MQALRSCARLFADHHLQLSNIDKKFLFAFRAKEGEVYEDGTSENFNAGFAVTLRAPNPQ